MDYAATSPVKPEVLAAMRPYFSDKFGNPSSIHSFGQETRQAINRAREEAAKFLNCQPQEVIFTSGGTESDNLAIRGTVLYHQNEFALKKPHIITSLFEHHAILHTCEDLEKMGLAEVTYIKPDKEGIIHVEDIKQVIKNNTVIVSIMYVNNEIGTVQPIAEIGSMISELKSNNQKLKTIFHTDAVQAAEYFSCNVEELKVDMLSLSAHKFGGPKGIGLLFLKQGTPLKPIQTGGAQEYHLRAGTENVPGIIGLAKAIQLLSSKFKVQSSKLMKLRNYFIDMIIKKIPDVKLNGSRKFRSPNNVSLSFRNAEGESILLNLDLLGVAASSGSACTSGSLEPSHVLRAIGVSDEDAHGAVRFTLGESTTKEQIDYVIRNLVIIIAKLRKMSPYK